MDETEVWSVEKADGYKGEKREVVIGTAAHPEA